MSQSSTAPIINPSIFIKPSKRLSTYISNVKISDDLPNGISNIIFKNKNKKIGNSLPIIQHLITEDDEKFIKSISSDVNKNILTELPLNKSSSINNTDKVLSIVDLHWLYNYIQKDNKDNAEKVYLHELIEGSQIILPKNEEVPRNEELEKRCKQLKAQQENESYFKMTKNVDNRRRTHPEDTIGYQMKQMNRHMVAIFQFIMSVAAGFAFGFIGIELLIGNLDFGFRLLLGIICALTVALAELYFLAKTLNEDINFESSVESKIKKGIKLD